MNITTYKGRFLCTKHPVEIYRCLNRKGHIFSIRQFNKVVGHTDTLKIFDCIFKIGDGGKKRSIREMTRNVHAYIHGYLVGEEPHDLTKTRLLYKPFIERGFHCEGMNNDLTESQMVELNENGIFAYI